MFLYYLIETFFKEKSRWFSWVPVLFGLGIGIYFSLSREPSLWLTLALVETLIFFAFLLRYQPAGLFFIGVLSVVVLGFANVQLKANYLNQTPFVSGAEKLYLKGTVVGLDYNTKGNIRLLLSGITDYDDNTRSGIYKITILSKKSPAEIGECVELVANIMPPFAPAMVGGYQFDRKTFFENIKATGYSNSRAIKIDCPNNASKSYFSAFVASVRNRIVARINKVLPPDEASITAAIIAGERGNMSKQLINNYRDSGLAHFLSISGLHMSMLAGMMFFLVRFIISLIPSLALRYDSKKISAVFAIFMSAVYLVISGAAIPTERAFIMTFIILLGVLFSRQAISMLTISWAAMIVLVLSPEALIGPSFQMSFAAVIVLIAFYERYAKSLHYFLNGVNSKHISLFSKFPRLIFAYIVGILVSDLVASLATLPFSIYHFNRIAIYTTLGNLLAGPVIGLLIMPFVLLSLLLMPLGLDFYALKIVGYGVNLVNQVTAYVASLPHAGLPVLGLPLCGLIAIVLGGLWLCIWQEKWRRLGWIGIIIGSLSMLTNKVPDVMVDATGTVVAVKDNADNLVVLPSRGKYFIKNIWIDKTAGHKLNPEQKKQLKDIWDGKSTNKAWLDLECTPKQCRYKNKVIIIKGQGVEINGNPFDAGKALGASIYIKTNDIEIDTVRDNIGNRFWN